MTRTALRVAGLSAAAGCAAAGLVLIWIARLSADRYVYVSELGASGEPTAPVFQTALVLVAASALVAAFAAPPLRPSVRWLDALPSGAVLVVAGAAFAVASQVTCTKYCPLPVGEAFTWQDLIHTVAAVIGFAAASFVMLQAAADRTLRGLARFSLGSAIAVAVIAGAGGLLSLLRFGTQVGGILELVATTIALAWLVGLALFLAIGLLKGASPRTAARPAAEAAGARSLRA
jgi:hypothetical protein